MLICNAYIVFMFFHLGLTRSHASLWNTIESEPMLVHEGDFMVHETLIPGQYIVSVKGDVRWRRERERESGVPCVGKSSALSMSLPTPLFAVAHIQIPLHFTIETSANGKLTLEDHEFDSIQALVWGCARAKAVAVLSDAPPRLFFRLFMHPRAPH